MKIIDVSSYNPIKDAFAVKKAGYSGVISKATEGKIWNNPTFYDDIAKAKQAGLIVGAYHFARPDNSQPEDEAIHYVNVVKSFDGMLPPILDIEKAGKLNCDQLTQWVLRWLQKAEELTGLTPWIYTGSYFYVNNLNPSLLKKYPLWVAQYSSYKPKLNYILWQYTDNENVPGVGKCDSSITDVDLNQFIKGGGNFMLKRGDVGQVVKTLQTQLNKLGYNLVADGVFGPSTEAAVKDFQAKHGLTVDGIVGPATQAAIDKSLQPQPQPKPSQPQPQPKPSQPQPQPAQTRYTIVFDDKNRADLAAQVLGGKVKEVQ